MSCAYGKPTDVQTHMTDIYAHTSQSTVYLVFSLPLAFIQRDEERRDVVYQIETGAVYVPGRNIPGFPSVPSSLDERRKELDRKDKLDKK